MSRREGGDRAECDQLTASKCSSNPGKRNYGSIIADVHRDHRGERNHEEAAETVERREAVSGKEHVDHQDTEHSQIANVDPVVAKAFGGEHDAPPERHEISVQDQPPVRGTGILRRVNKPFETGE